MWDGLSQIIKEKIVCSKFHPNYNCSINFHSNIIDEDTEVPEPETKDIVERRKKEHNSMFYDT